MFVFLKWWSCLVFYKKNAIPSAKQIYNYLVKYVLEYDSLLE